MTQREEFEKFAADHLVMLGASLEKHAEIGEYLDGAMVACYLTWKAAINSFQLPDRMEYELHGDTVIDSHHNTFADGYNQALSDVISMNEEYANSTEPEQPK